MSFSTYRGYKIFDLFPYFTEQHGGEYNQKVSKFGTIGHIHSYVYEDYPRYITRHSYLCNGLDAIKEVNNFFDELKGRNGELWFPTWIKDINITASISKYQVHIPIDDIQYSTFYPLSHITGSNILIYVSKNRYYARQVVELYSNTEIEIDSALGSPLGLSELKMCSFLYFGRLNIDQIEWKYKTPTIATCMFEFIDLPKQTP